MRKHAFSYVNYRGLHRTITVKGCPDTEVVRLMLEWALDTEVAVREIL